MMSLGGTSGVGLQSELAPAAVMKRERYQLKKKYDLSSSEEEEWTGPEEEEDSGPPTDSGYSTGSLSPSPPPQKKRGKDHRGNKKPLGSERIRRRKK